MKKLMIVNGYIWMLVLPFIINGYLKTGKVGSKWGDLSGDSAKWGLVGYSIMALAFGFYSILETKKIINQR